MYEPAAGAALRPWRKILYEKQPFEDNYVDESFLEGLVKNANFRRMEFWHIVPKTLAIVQQLSALCVIYVAFTHTLLVRCARRATFWTVRSPTDRRSGVTVLPNAQRSGTPNVMFWLSPLTFVLGYMLRNFMRPGGMAPSGAKGHIDNGFYFVYFLGQSGMASAACPITLS